MPPFTVLLASFAVVGSLPILWWALSGTDTAGAARVVQNLGDRRPTNMREAVLDRPALERLVLPLLRGTGRFGRRFTPIHWIRRIETQLAAAGRLGRFSAEQIVGGKILASALAALWLTLRFLGTPTPGGLALLVGGTAFAFFVPDLLLKAASDRRKETIQLALPDMLDQLTISVEAGLGFEAAISRIAARDGGPLGEEFGRMIQDVRLGVPRMDALNDVGVRTGADDLRQLVLALRQADKLGVPLAKTLRLQASELRERRRFRAEEAAYKLPVKMIFPLGFCILPALFIVVLGPAAIRLGEIF